MSDPSEPPIGVSTEAATAEARRGWSSSSGGEPAAIARASSSSRSGACRSASSKTSCTSVPNAVPAPRSSHGSGSASEGSAAVVPSMVCVAAARSATAGSSPSSSAAVSPRPVASSGRCAVRMRELSSWSAVSAENDQRRDGGPMWRSQMSICKSSPDVDEFAEGVWPDKGAEMNVSSATAPSGAWACTTSTASRRSDIVASSSSPATCASRHIRRDLCDSLAPGAAQTMSRSFARVSAT